MKYFTNIRTLDELKAAYRRLALKCHPDMGGSTEIMQEINAEHDALFEQLKRQHNAHADEYHQTTETAEEFREILEVVLAAPGGCARTLPRQAQHEREPQQVRQPGL